MFIKRTYELFDQYRIAETADSIWIERKAFCNNNKSEEWHPVDSFGGIHPSGSIGSKLIEYFISKKEARRFAKKLMLGTVYHKC